MRKSYIKLVFGRFKLDENTAEIAVGYTLVLYVATLQFREVIYPNSQKPIIVFQAHCLFEGITSLRVCLLCCVQPEKLIFYY